MNQRNDENWLHKAIELSSQCRSSERAFSVGAIIVGVSYQMISSGFSRERKANEHAEELAIAKALEKGENLKGATIYSSLEPCNPRLSGKTSCTDLIIRSGITKVVFALHEPSIFVSCTGATRLKDSGVEVVILDELAGLVKENNKRFFPE